jgi:4-hydroxy-2-oxoheptanedioate aldolase
MAEKMRYNKIIDLLEHGKPVFSTSTVPNGSPMVRLPPNARECNQWVIKQALDTGVYGLVLPHLSTVEDAQAAVAAARYPQDFSC